MLLLPPPWRRPGVIRVPALRPGCATGLQSDPLGLKAWLQARRVRWREWLAMGCLLALLMPLGLALAPAALADSLPPAETYRCDGEVLIAQIHPGAVDAADIPNRSGDTLPGAFLSLEWQGVRLQLPRTNDAGAPSFSDGKWWWSLEDPAHPRFRRRRSFGDVQDFRCQQQP